MSELGESQIEALRLFIYLDYMNNISLISNEKSKSIVNLPSEL